MSFEILRYIYNFKKIKFEELNDNNFNYKSIANCSKKTAPFFMCYIF